MDYISLLQSARLETFLNSALEIGIALLICLVSLWASYRSKKRSDLDEIEDGELRRPLGSRQKISAPSTLRPLIIGIAVAVLTVSFGVDIAIDIARINRDISEEVEKLRADYTEMKYCFSGEEFDDALEALIGNIGV